MKAIFVFREEYLMEFDASKYRGNTEEDDERIIYALNNYQRLTVDKSNKIWTHGGVYIADVHQVASSDDSLKPLLTKTKKS
jgi:hypothetical protein